MIKNIDKITKLEYSITGNGLRAKQCGKLSTSRLPILFIKKFKKNIDFFQIKIYNRIMKKRPRYHKAIYKTWGGILWDSLYSVAAMSPTALLFKEATHERK